eukprot:2101966-Amphidinium_carterae.1
MDFWDLGIGKGWGSILGLGWVVQYPAMAPGGAAGFPSTAVILTRWSALAEQLSLTSPSSVQLTGWVRTWSSYVILLMAGVPNYEVPARATALDVCKPHCPGQA